MNSLLQELRFGVRLLAQKPGFTLTAILTLALGIGATTAIFSVINGVLLKPLPYKEADRILRLGQQWNGGPIWAASEPKFLFWREHNQSFESLAAYQNIGSGFNLAGSDEAEFVDGMRVTEDFLRVLNINPALGRGFTREEDLPNSGSVVMLSDGLWQRRFGGEPTLVGKTISLNGQAFTVVGILPPHFRFLPEADVFVPLRPSIQGDPNPNYGVIGRLKSGITSAQANDEIKRLAEQYAAQYPKDMQPRESAGAELYQETFMKDLRPLLWILFGAVAFLLLIACANVANLQLARAAARQKEIAVRMALGAGGWRVVRQLLVESLLLALTGGLLGAVVAKWGTDALLAAMPEGLIHSLADITFDVRGLVFTLAAALLTGVIFGLAPAWQSTRVDVNDALKEGAGKGAGGASHGRLRSALVVVEIALSLVLLIGAMLLARTFSSLRGVDPGFDSRNVLTFYISPNGDRYDNTAKTVSFQQRALERIKALPGVENAATSNVLPLVAQLNLPFEIVGRNTPNPSAQIRYVSPEYFDVLKLQVRQGRAFTDTDKAGAAGVIMLNEAFLKQFLPDATPLGQVMTVARGLNDSPRQVVGVVGDVKQFGMDVDAPPTMFIPYAQVPDKMLLLTRRWIAGYFMVRTTVDPLSLTAAVKRELATIDPALPPSSVRTLEQIVARSVAPQRFNMLLLGLFAGIGLILAAVGIYGVMSYNVAQRTHEIGIRMALGAQTRDVLQLVVRQGLTLSVIGIGLGLLAAFGLTRMMKTLLFGVTATDPLTFVLISGVLLLVALLACFIPARRATKTDPMIALRGE